MGLLPEAHEILAEIKQNPGKYQHKAKSKKNKKKLKYWQKGYVETEQERKDRVRNFMAPIYQPIGLGKKR
jgi:TRAP-type C4-dicarboxylate transport system substrate-binding protein